MNRLLQVSVLFVIIFFLFGQLLVSELQLLIIEWLSSDNGSFESRYSIALSISWIPLNAIVAFITLSDTSTSKLRWLVFFVTLVYIPVGIVFLLIARLSEALVDNSAVAEEKQDIA